MLTCARCGSAGGGGGGGGGRRAAAGSRRASSSGCVARAVRWAAGGARVASLVCSRETQESQGDWLVSRRPRQRPGARLHCRGGTVSMVARASGDPAPSRPAPMPSGPPRADAPRVLVCDDSATMRALHPARCSSRATRCSRHRDRRGGAASGPPASTPTSSSPTCSCPAMSGSELCRALRDLPALAERPLHPGHHAWPTPPRGPPASRPAPTTTCYKPLRERELRARVASLLRLRRAMLALEARARRAGGGQRGARARRRTRWCGPASWPASARWRPGWPTRSTTRSPTSRPAPARWRGSVDEIGAAGRAARRPPPRPALGQAALDEARELAADAGRRQPAAGADRRRPAGHRLARRAGRGAGRPGRGGGAAPCCWSARRFPAMPRVELHGRARAAHRVGRPAARRRGCCRCWRTPCRCPGRAAW